VELDVKKALEKAYLETTYSVFVDNERHDIKVGKTIPMVVNQLLEHEKSGVVLTAFNPRSKSKSIEENHLRNNDLSLHLKKNNYEFYKAVGQGNETLWPAEESFLIIGLSPTEAENLAKEFEQYAYIWLEQNNIANIKFTSIWND